MSQATYSSYESIIRIHIKPALGDMSLIDLQPNIIRKFLDKKVIDGKSKRTVEYIHVILKAALTLAVNDGLLYRHPMAGVKKPHVQKSKMVVLTLTQLRWLLATIDDSEYFRLIYVAANTGLRREEILALRIQDINTRKHTLSVEQTLHYNNQETYITPTTKNQSSHRTISLNDITFSYIKKQIVCVQKEKLATLNYQDNDLLFPTQNGLPLFPAYVSRKLKKYVKLLKLPDDFTFHGLRHTHATLLLESGVNFKLIQTRLGHSSFKVTMDTYSHVTPDMEQSLIEKILDLSVSVK